MGITTIVCVFVITALAEAKMKTCKGIDVTDCECPDGKFMFTYPGGTGFCKSHRKCSGKIKTKGTPWNDTMCDESDSSSVPQTAADLPPTTTETPTTLSSETTPRTRMDSGIFISTGTLAGIVFGTIVVTVIIIAIVSLIYGVYLCVKKKQGLLWNIKQKLTCSTPEDDGTKNESENNQPLNYQNESDGEIRIDLS